MNKSNTKVSPDFNLGTHTRTISAQSLKAQQWFNLGLNWCYAFNQEEGVKCFCKALEHDPQCAMAHWGVAYASGPFYNNLWRDFSTDEANHTTAYCDYHIQQARHYQHTATDIENHLIEALAYRFQQPYAVDGSQYDQWDDDYANAMRRVYYCYRNDHDVMALFAEAIMTRTAWKLWDVTTGVPPENADTYEALEVIERSIKINDQAGQPQHPAILHLHIHATEMSDTPERAMRSANRLAALCPDAGHLHHMPGHIYVLTGQYLKAKKVSEDAIRADDKYLDYAGPYNFYTTARCHDLHLMMYTCMFLGQFKPALQAAEKMRATLSKKVLNTPEHPQTAITMEGYYSMQMHVLVRFGQWQQIIDSPLPCDSQLYCVSTAMHYYARGVAMAALGRVSDAEQQRQLFIEAVSKVPDDRKFFNNPAHSILAVAEKMLDGEINYRKGNYSKAFEHLRESVKRDDTLEYSEPWAWMHPPRHALAALLLEQKHFEEAEDVYRTDLGLNNKLHRCAQHPDNVWALYGLVQCLQQRNEQIELPRFKKKLNHALTLTDTPITASCMCAGIH